ncbi:MAG TPA: hypothetical protein VFE05_06735 [Longimicrobiaceae bacterium]|jgi:hypothetical protein|nr:hypothetical protein [Longimicrobiaceae bacterium]
MKGSTSRRSLFPARLGLALGPDRLVAVRMAGRLAPHPAEVLECALEPPTAEGWPSLAEALRDLSAELGVQGARVDVALLRRLAHARVLPLPPLGRAELAALVLRGARRHFAVRDETLVADAVRLPLPRDGSLAPALAACAPAELAGHVATACTAAGLRVSRLVPGAAALSAGAQALAPDLRRGRALVVACSAGGAEILLLDGGAVARIQPLAPADSLSVEPQPLGARVLAALHAGEEMASAARIAVCGTGAAADDVRGALLTDAELGERVVVAAGMDGLPADAVAAMGAVRAGREAPVLLHGALTEARVRAARRRTLVQTAGSAALLVAAAWLHLDGVRREVDAVRARREQIRRPVAEAIEAHATVEQLRAELATLSALESAAPVWSGEIAAVARSLPDSAHLRTFVADSGGVRLGGVARSASGVVPALAATRRYDRVSLASPVRWEQGDAGERFDVAAFLAAAAVKP